MLGGGSPSPLCPGGSWSSRRCWGEPERGNAPTSHHQHLTCCSWLDHRDLGISFWSHCVFLSGTELPERGTPLSLEVLLLFNKGLCGIVP